MSEQHLVCPYCGKTSRVEVPDLALDTVPAAEIPLRHLRQLLHDAEMARSIRAVMGVEDDASDNTIIWLRTWLETQGEVNE